MVRVSLNRMGRSALCVGPKLLCNTSEKFAERGQEPSAATLGLFEEIHLGKGRLSSVNICESVGIKKKKIIVNN